MTEAEKAYEAAVAAIMRTDEIHGMALDLSGEEFKHLNSLPSQLLKLANLKSLNISNTRISSLSLLVELSGLQEVYFSGTNVVDITPLTHINDLYGVVLDKTEVDDISALKQAPNLLKLSLHSTKVTDISALKNARKLQSLSVSNTKVSKIDALENCKNLIALSLNMTKVSDLSPLMNLKKLSILSISGTEVLDLRPILGDNKLGLRNDNRGLWFYNTPAVHTPELTRISRLENRKECAKAAKAYFKDLPPWPEPLPWEMVKPSYGTELEAIIPSAHPAPLQVVEDNGVLRPAKSTETLGDAGDILAQSGWQALREYLEDLEDKWYSIHNAMPRLAKSMRRLDTALAQDFANINAIAVGTQGNRFIRLAKLAPETLMDEDAADIEQFAATLALFLERFPEWRAYRDAAEQTPINASDIENAIPAFTELSTELEQHPEIAPEIPQSLNAQATDIVEISDDAISTNGLINSTRNVLSALATAALPIVRWVKSEAIDISETTWSGTKKLISGAAISSVGGLGISAYDILFNKATILQKLGTQFPNQFGWLLDFLKFVGL